MYCCVIPMFFLSFCWSAWGFKPFTQKSDFDRIIWPSKRISDYRKNLTLRLHHDLHANIELHATLNKLWLQLCKANREMIKWTFYKILSVINYCSIILCRHSSVILFPFIDFMIKLLGSKTALSIDDLLWIVY